MLLIIELGFAVATAMVASDRGRGKLAWFTLGLFLGPLALVIAYLTEPLEWKALENGTHKKCSFCAELVKFEARVCRHCGREF